MSLFLGIMFISTVALAFVYILLVFGQLRASNAIHKMLIESVLSAPLRAVDDIDSLANQLWPLSATLASMLVRSPFFWCKLAYVECIGEVR
ncbi:hypothetical protein B0H10DRAFT_2151262 [Mycena sp. CBHHK59/15]|nr:hypothetical protein B0H10DRAFT_2151262 [Mycena sp. CBHHK59/15]